MIDLRLYKPSGRYEDVNWISENMQLVLPEDPKASSIEVIAGKVVKFMLTEKGSDAFSPEYGTTSMHYIQMSQTFFPQFRREVLADVEACEKYLKNADLDYDVSGEMLDHIDVLKITYDPLNTPWRVDVYLEIVTTLQKRAVVAITPRTEN